MRTFLDTVRELCSILETPGAKTAVLIFFVLLGIVAVLVTKGAQGVDFVKYFTGALGLKLADAAVRKGD